MEVATDIWEGRREGKREKKNPKPVSGVCLEDNLKEKNSRMIVMIYEEVKKKGR